MQQPFYSRLLFVLLLTALLPITARAQSPTDLLAKLETALADEDEKLAPDLWKRLTPEFDGLSKVDQGRFLVAQGLVQEDILRDINSADQSFNRVITLLDADPEPTQPLADAYYERAYIKYIRTHNLEEYCPDREKAVAIARKLTAKTKLPKYLTALAFCYGDSTARLQQGLDVLNEALTVAQSMELKPLERRLIYNATSTLYRKNQLYAQAYEYAQLAYNTTIGTTNYSAMNTEQHNLLMNAIDMGKLDKAEQHGHELLKLADVAPQFKDFRFFAYYDNGLVAMAQNDLPRAIKLFGQARSEEHNTEETSFIAANRAQMAQAYLLQGDTDAAMREATAVSKLPGFKSIQPEQRQIMQSLLQLSGRNPAQSAQTLYSLYRAEQQKQREFVANAALDHAQRHNTRIQKYEEQLLKNELQIQQLKLSAQERQQEAERLYLILAAVIAVSLALLACTLWRSRRRFRTQAQTDPLTGIANRRHFLERAELVARKNRQQPEAAAVLVLDIDHFKLINDAHGHQAGDAAIRHVAAHAMACLRGDDVFGRIGGEEFAALLPGTDDAAAKKMAERIRLAVEQSPLNHQGDEIHITVSIGLTSGSLDRDHIESLMQRADKVMYRAKNAGRNRTFSYADHQADIAAANSAVG